jgi:hypothetical protein
MNRATELRILKLESAAPSPPSGFDEFTSDELMVQLLEGYRRFWIERTFLQPNYKRCKIGAG